MIYLSIRKLCLYGFFYENVKRELLSFIENNSRSIKIGIRFNLLYSLCFRDSFYFYREILQDLDSN